jgi:hypothetical protein
VREEFEGEMRRLYKWNVWKQTGLDCALMWSTRAAKPSQNPMIG